MPIDYYRDLDFNFTRHPLYNDVAVITNANAVKKSIINLLQLKSYEKPFHPEINSGFGNLLFELASPLTIDALREKMIYIIEKYEPRAKILDLTIIPDIDINTVKIFLKVNIINLTAPISFSVSLVRNR